MTQEKINKYFMSDLGMQCDTLFTTSDDMVFIRHEEAVAHSNGELVENSVSLEDKTIQQWFLEEPEIN